jgi:hypothetical protein
MNIQRSMTDLFGSACYAYCIAYIFSGKDDVKDLTRYVLHGWFNGYLDDDGYVRYPIKYVALMGKKFTDVSKVEIESLMDLPDEGIYAVEYVYGVKHHFVVCRRGEVVFDPWEDSDTVKYGKPISYRWYF